jgi:tetratricopeptide (TPR) repeat protein
LEAGRIFQLLASGAEDYYFAKRYELWCDAAYAFLLADHDQAMDAARRCIADGATKPQSERSVALGHRVAAIILEDRSAYPSALEHARQAVELEPTHFYGYLVMAQALNGLERPSEAESAAQKAVDFSDGKNARAHAALGHAYFSQKKWKLAKRAFEAAARSDPSYAEAAYNVAVSLDNDGFEEDAVFWYEEALRRNPKIENHEQIRQTLRRLKGQQ